MLAAFSFLTFYSFFTAFLSYFFHIFPVQTLQDQFAIFKPCFAISSRVAGLLPF